MPPITSRGRGDLATALLGLVDAFTARENERLRAEGKQPAAPQSMEDVSAMLLHDQPFTDVRYAIGPQEGEQHWSPAPGLNYPPDDIPLRQISPLVSLDPETGMLYAVPPFAGEGKSGVNYADFAMERGLARPGFREDIAEPNRPHWRPYDPPQEFAPAPLLQDLARLLMSLTPSGIEAATNGRR